MDEGTADGNVEVVCPSCGDLVAVNGELEDVSPGDPIHAFCASCEHNVEVAAPVGIDAVHGVVDAVTHAVTEFPSGNPQS